MEIGIYSFIYLIEKKNDSQKHSRNGEDEDKNKKQKVVISVKEVYKSLKYIILSYFIKRNDYNGYRNIFNITSDRMNFILQPLIGKDYDFNYLYKYIIDNQHYFFETFNFEEETIGKLTNYFNSIAKEEEENIYFIKLLDILERANNKIEIVSTEIDDFVNELKSSLPSNDIVQMIEITGKNETNETNDSFCMIVNKLFIEDGIFGFTGDGKVFQFPKNKIYIRKCYIVTYYNILKYLKSNNKNIILVGQPGIGKTSFIYYLLYKIMKKNYIIDASELIKSQKENEIEVRLKNNEKEICILKEKKLIFEERKEILNEKINSFQTDLLDEMKKYLSKELNAINENYKNDDFYTKEMKKKNEEIENDIKEAEKKGKKEEEITKIKINKKTKKKIYSKIINNIKYIVDKIHKTLGITKPDIVNEIVNFLKSHSLTYSVYQNKIDDLLKEVKECDNILNNISQYYEDYKRHNDNIKAEKDLCNIIEEEKKEINNLEKKNKLYRILLQSNISDENFKKLFQSNISDRDYEMTLHSQNTDRMNELKVEFKEIVKELKESKENYTSYYKIEASKNIIEELKKKNEILNNKILCLTQLNATIENKNIQKLIEDNNIAIKNNNIEIEDNNKKLNEWNETIKENNEKLKDKIKEIITDEGKRDYILNELYIIEKEIEEEIKEKKIEIDNNIEYFKDIIKEKEKLYIVKASKGGELYNIYEYDKLNKVIIKRNLEIDEIKDSVVITDTCGIVDKSNFIISISSPSDQNIKNYKLEGKTIYIDSYSDKELKEWYDKCIYPEEENERNLFPQKESEDFKEICKLYGNVTRQIYFHFIYHCNGMDYWNYYTQLINSVIGTIGYENFKEQYTEKTVLADNPLLNIIMKYDMKINNEGNIEPKDTLTFVSPAIANYVSSLFKLPENKEEYKVLLKYYLEIENDETMLCNKFISKLLYKQIIAYRICNGIIGTGLNVDLFDIDNCPSIIYNPSDCEIAIRYILNNDNDFDYIIGDTFVKIINDAEDRKFIEAFKEKYNNKYKCYGLEREVLYKEVVVVEKIEKIEEEEKDDDDEEQIEEEEEDDDDDDDYKDDDYINEEKERVRQIEKERKRRQEQTVSIEYPNIPPPPAGTPLPLSAILPDRSNKSLSTFNMLYGRVNTVEYTEESKYLGCFKINNYYYILRECYKDIINRIDKSTHIQGNYLIFGNKGIGKKILSDFLNFYYISHQMYNVLYIIKDKVKTTKEQLKCYYKEKEQNKYYSLSYPKIPPNPYIVISCGVVIGEDEFADAEKVIVIYDSADENIKTYQSKRCPLIMYIPPFNESEIEKLVVLEVKYNDESKKNEIVNKIIKYGKIPKNYLYNENEIIKEIKSKLGDYKIIVLIEEMINGINKSPISKGYPSEIFIYETFEDDITNSNRLIFLSEKVKHIVRDEYIKIKTKGNINRTIELFEKNQTGSLGGNIYEKIITHFIQIKKDNIYKEISRILSVVNNNFKQKKFRDMNINDSNNYNFTTYKKICNKDILELIKDFKEKINFIDYDYMPDLDGSIDYLGLQYTVAVTHGLSAEIVIFLHNFKLLFKYIKDRNIDQAIQSCKSDEKYINDDNFENFEMKILDLDYVIISNNRNVNITRREVKEINKFPVFIQKLIPDEELFKRNSSRCEDIIKTLNIKKHIVCITSKDFNKWKN